MSSRLLRISLNKRRQLPDDSLNSGNVSTLWVLF